MKILLNRPDDMVRITTPELAQQYIDEQIAIVKEQVGDKKVLLALLRKWKLLVIVALIGAAAGYFYTANFTTLTYSSSVEFLAYATDGNDEINSTASAEVVRSSNTSKMNYAMKMMDTYIEIMKTNEFAKDLADDLNTTYNANYTANSVMGTYSIVDVEGTAMFRVSVTTTSADLSYKIAKQLETTIPKMMKEKNNGLVRATVEDRAVKASSARSLGYPKKMIISTAIALVIAAAYIILRTLLDVRVKSSDELTEKYSIPVLGEIPNFESRVMQQNTTTKGAKRNG